MKDNFDAKTVEDANWNRVEKIRELLASVERDLASAIAKRSVPRLSASAQSVSNAGHELTRLLGRIEQAAGIDNL